MAIRRFVYLWKNLLTFSFMTLGVELMKNDAINRLFPKSFPKRDKL